MAKVYVVLCHMEGCEECGDEVHVVAVRSKKVNADEIAKAHRWEHDGTNKKHNRHLHPNYVDVLEVEVDGTPDYQVDF